MCTNLRPSGLSPVGPLNWGSHFCQFYRTRDDLLDALVPFFAAGLATNEQCLWVVSDPLDVPTAERALRAVVPDLDARVARGQMEFVDGDAWYRSGSFDAETTLQGWLARERHAREAGFEGLRATGNTLWTHGAEWDAFVEYERRVNELFRDFRLIALCTYHVDSCGANEVLDVVRNHEFAVARRSGEWEVVESSSLKVAKEALRAANEQLEERVHQRTRELEHAVRARDEFLAMLGHELRNPLAPIRNAARIVAACAGDDERLAQAGAMLERQARQMTRLVDDLLDVARVTQGKIVLAAEPLELAPVLAQALETVREPLERRGHRLAWHLPDEPLALCGDRARLAQVFANLLDNAVKYTPPGGTIEVRAVRDGEAVTVAIRDTGVGIAPELLDRVFEPFAQVDQTIDRANGGLGLGLSVVRRLVEKHGGTVNAHSDGPGRGTELRVRLPLA